MGPGLCAKKSELACSGGEPYGHGYIEIVPIGLRRCPDRGLE